MSQYPQHPQYPQYPYSGPPMYGLPDPQADLIRPAKRASLLMFILAGLMLSCGACFGLASLVSLDGLEGQQRTQFEQLEADLGMPFSAAMRTASGMMLIPGALLLILAILVRRGGMVTAIFALLLAVLMALMLLLGAINGILVATQDPRGIMQLAMFVVPLVLVVLLMVWLFQAARNAPRLAELRAGQQAAYWQSAQQRQDYTTGYWQPPPPPPEA